MLRPERVGATRVNEIDLLRFLAAMAVVFYHYAFRGYAADNLSLLSYPALLPMAKYGYLGVELFFMISGFVIFMSVRSGGLRAFVISRVVRLYPAFLACCTLTYAFSVMSGDPRFQFTIGQFLINLTMLGGFVGVVPIDGAYWSLFVEMRFYGFVGFVLLLKQLRRAELFLWLWLIVTLGLVCWPNGKFNTLLIGDFAAFFIAGAVNYLIWSEGFKASRLLALVLCWGLAVWQALARLPALELHYGTSMSELVVFCVVSGFFVVMLLIALRRTGPLGARRWTLAGALTYPLYLLHQNIGYILFNAYTERYSPHLLMWLVLALVFAGAYAVHRFVEQPLALPLKRFLNRSVDAVYARWARSSQTR